MITGVRKLKLPCNCLKSKILATKKVTKVFQDKEKGEIELLVGICFNKGVV